MSADPLNINFSSIYFIEQLKAQKADAITPLVKTYTPQLYRAALGMGFQKEEATELVQTTWTTFFEKVPQFEGRSHIRTYLFGFLYNKAKEQRRDQSRYELHDPIDSQMEQRFTKKGHWKNPPRQPDELFQDSENLETILQCLEKLPFNQKSAFLLRELEGHSTSEICNILELTTTHLGVILYRAKNRLRECIENLGVKRTSK